MAFLVSLPSVHGQDARAGGEDHLGVVEGFLARVKDTHLCGHGDG